LATRQVEERRSHSKTKESSRHACWGLLLTRSADSSRLGRRPLFAHRGKVRYPRHDDHTTQAHCHSLVVNACVLSTTGYLEDAIDAQRAAGHPVSDDAISHLSPGHYEPINPYGTLNFDVANVVERPRRPLRGA
jgi:hypothetical protein